MRKCNSAKEKQGKELSSKSLCTLLGSLANQKGGKGLWPPLALLKLVKKKKDGHRAQPQESQVLCPPLDKFLETLVRLQQFPSHPYFRLAKVNLPQTRAPLSLSGADPGFDQGGPQIVTGLNCRQCAAALCERSEPFSAWGPGPTLGPQKLLGISLLNMHSLHLGVPFYTIFEIIKY